MGYTSTPPGLPGSAPAVASSLRREPTLPVIVAGERTPESVALYFPTLLFVEQVAAAEGITISAHHLHAHPKGSWACFTAETDFDALTITWCTLHGSPDRRSAIHELAHLAVDDYHTVYWATKVHELADRYLSPREAARLKREIARDYPAGRSTYQRATGKRLR